MKRALGGKNYIHTHTHVYTCTHTHTHTHTHKHTHTSTIKVPFDLRPQKAHKHTQTCNPPTHTIPIVFLVHSTIHDNVSIKYVHVYILMSYQPHLFGGKQCQLKEEIKRGSDYNALTLSCGSDVFVMYRPYTHCFSGLFTHTRRMYSPMLSIMCA